MRKGLFIGINHYDHVSRGGAITFHDHDGFRIQVLGNEVGHGS